MRKKELEILLQRLPGHPSPVAGLEQVHTPASIAADALYMVHSMGDIQGRDVADLGCGTGILGIGCSLLGAKSVLAADLDSGAVDIGRVFAVEVGADVHWMVGDIGDFHERVDTVVMNPPFGAQKKHADRPFLCAAMEHSSVAYTFILAGTLEFVEAWCMDRGWLCETVRSYKFPLLYTHPFHRMEKKMVDVCFLRLSPGESAERDANAAINENNDLEVG